MAEEKLQFQYFYGSEADMFTFYRIPKILFTDDYFKELSSDAKILYGLMLDRMSLSRKNGWIDEDNRVYVYFTVEDAMELMNIGKNKVIRIMSELDQETGVGLIERIRQGQGKPSIIYVKSVVREGRQKSQNETTKDIDNSEVSNRNFKKFQNETSSCFKTGHPEVCFSNPNNTDNSNTDINKSIHLISSSGQEAMEKMRSIRDQLEIDLLVERYPLDRDLYEGIYELVLDVMMNGARDMEIASGTYPTAMVKERFSKLNSMHLEYVVGCMKSNSQKIGNIKKYVLAALFNAPCTIDGYFLSQVNYDFPQFVGR